MNKQGNTTMKLIKILALTAALASMATAQTTGGSNPQPGNKATATPTPGKAATTATKPGQPTITPQAGAAPKATPAVNAPKTGSVPGAKAGAPPVIVATPSAAQANTKTGASKAGVAPQAKPSPVPALPSGKITPATVGKKSGKKKKSGEVVAATTTKKKSTKSGLTVSKKPKAPPKLAEVAPPEKSEKKKPTSRLAGAAGRRDPFVSPIRAPSGPQGPGAGCSSGKRCLAIPELVLRGTVRDISGKMLAVVANSAQRTYTLRENDQVFNGSVEKITSDSIIFREFVKDALGRETAREVVKKLGPTS
jgi:hypothetical protein